MADAEGKQSTIPRCVCSWKNCRVYQKFFKEHQVWDGVVKLKFVTTEPESMALKASIDRLLKVQESKAQEWKPGRTAGQEIARYNVACHHWTAQHIKKYKGDPTKYSFLKPFSVHGAQKYLYKVDPKETFKDPSREADELLYLQCPLVPKDEVKNLFYKIKEVQDQKLYSKKNGTKSGHVVEKQVPVEKTDNSRRIVSDDRKDSLTVSTNRSTKTTEVLLQEKESENKRLKDQLESMQSQLAFLHDMVRKLQEEQYDHQSRSGSSRHRMGMNSGHRRRQGGAAAGDANNSSRRTGSRSSRSSVPNEIEIESEDDGNWIEPAIDEEWSEEDGEDHDVQEDDKSVGTFHVNFQAQRRNSFSSRASRTSRATSIVSASKSVKSLPREIELDDDDESRESLEEEAFDNKSFASSKKQLAGRGKGKAGSAHRRSSTGGAKQPRRRQSIGERSSTSSRHRSGGSSDGNSLAGVYQVTALTVTDPYGEQGIYTGSISNSTGMPHGFGRLEYDKAGRWYEGDWKHGRWTGQGRLSNGDGDYYEGGLKNDHKHGKGVMKFSDGRVFEGEYINGQMVEGKMTYQDGSTYTGGWMDGMRHGRGRCVFTDQSVYEGEFREGEFFGYGKMSWSDGGWYEGEWYNGEMQGFGKEIRPDGSLRHEGQWAKGQPIRN